jgi:ketosteroid isomerase-like protein
MSLKKDRVMKKLLAISFVLLALCQSHFAWADAIADHDALRNLRKEAAVALSTNDFSHLAPMLDKDFTITTVDNHKFTSVDDFKAYWEGMFSGANPVLKSIEIDPSADALTNFLTPDLGIAYGSSVDTYHFTDGDVRKMDTRWTAVVRRNPDGWKLVAIHFSANLLDNPVLAAAKAKQCIYAAVGFVAGLVIALLLMYLCCCKSRCRKDKAAA